jgi:hypothetical protein
MAVGLGRVSYYDWYLLAARLWRQPPGRSGIASLSDAWGGNEVAFTPPEHAGEVRSALAEIVAEHGPEALSRPAAMTSLLADLLPEAPGLARLMVAAAQDRVAEELRGHVAQGMDVATAARLATSSFAATTLHTPEVCGWVVGEFAIALGLMTDAGQPSLIPAAPAAETAPHGRPRAAPTAGARPTAPETGVAMELVRAQPGPGTAAGVVPAEHEPERAAVAGPVPAAGILQGAATAPAPSALPGQVAGKPGPPRRIPAFRDWHPEISKRYRYWLLMAYIIPVAGFGVFGIPVLLLLMIRHDRLFRMNALQSLGICLLVAPTIAFSVTANLAARTTAPKALWAIAAGICGLAVISLLVFCVTQLARRRQPRIKVLSQVAYRLAYGRSSET